MADLCYGHICDEHSSDQSTAQQVLSFNEARDHEALDAASTSHSASGTSGLRAAVGDGKSRMNRAVDVRPPTDSSPVSSNRLANRS